MKKFILLLFLVSSKSAFAGSIHDPALLNLLTENQGYFEFFNCDVDLRIITEEESCSDGIDCCHRMMIYAFDRLRNNEIELSFAFHDRGLSESTAEAGNLKRDYLLRRVWESFEQKHYQIINIKTDLLGRIKAMDLYEGRQGDQPYRRRVQCKANFYE